MKVRSLGASDSFEFQILKMKLEVKDVTRVTPIRNRMKNRTLATGFSPSSRE